MDGSVNGDLEGFKGTGLPLTGDNPAKTIEPFDVVGAIAFRQAHWQRPPAKRAPYDRGNVRGGRWGGRTCEDGGGEASVYVRDVSADRALFCIRLLVFGDELLEHGEVSRDEARL